MSPYYDFLEKCRVIARYGTRFIAGRLNHLTDGRLTPNTVTLLAVTAHIPVAWLIAIGQPRWAALGLLIFGLFDALDGELARLQKRESTTGMLLDSITDRMKEVMLYTGLAYAIISSTDQPYMAAWAVAACGCSLLVSYVNAWGEAVVARQRIDQHSVNKSFRGGLFPFEVRMFILLAGLLSNQLILLAMVITIGAAYTAVSRLLRIFKALRITNVQS